MGFLRVLITNHLEDIAHNRLPIIQRRTGFDLGTINPKELSIVTNSLIPTSGTVSNGSVSGSIGVAPVGWNQPQD